LDIISFPSSVKRYDYYGKQNYEILNFIAVAILLTYFDTVVDKNGIHDRHEILYIGVQENIFLILQNLNR
jgi:hypothetical protein